MKREGLHTALRVDRHPCFDSMARVCKALGVKLVAWPTTLDVARDQALATVLA